MNLAQYIDHTHLKATGGNDDIEKLCQEAIKHEFAAVCVNPTWITKCSEMLKDSSVEIATVIGFPLGAMTTASKEFEANDALQQGATEIDMVMNIGKFLDKNYQYVENDIARVAQVCKDKVLKVIIETAYLTDADIVKASQIAVKAGANYVKTSTGFATSGATIEDVELIRKTVGKHIGVKAAGGIRTYQDALNMINAGATRIGASSGVEIVSGANE